MTHAIVDGIRWAEARQALLAEEKALIRATDRVAALRRRMPWKRVFKD